MTVYKLPTNANSFSNFSQNISLRIAIYLTLLKRHIDFIKIIVESVQKHLNLCQYLHLVFIQFKELSF